MKAQVEIQEKEERKEKLKAVLDKREDGEGIESRDRGDQPRETAWESVEHRLYGEVAPAATALGKWIPGHLIV